MEPLFQDIRYSLRMLRKSAGFALITVGTLALGIGANTAIFSIVNAVLLQPLPYPHSEKLVDVTEMVEGLKGMVREGDVSYPDFFDWRERNHAFESIASFHDDDFSLTGAGQPLHVNGSTVSSDFFSVLQVSPALGRVFRRDEEKPGARVVVLGHDLWQSVFGSDPNIIGRNITLNQQLYSVIGVMPSNFAFPPEPDSPKLWRSSGSDAESSAGGDVPAVSRRTYHFLSVVGRLKPGVSMEQASKEMNLIAGQLAREYPDSNEKRSTVKVISELEHVAGDTRPALIILLLSAGCVLLIACLNVANLLLARATKRSKEIALRASLGSSRARVVRQLFTEALILAMMGAVSGIPLAWGAIKVFSSLNADVLPRLKNAGLDGNVLAFTAAAGMLTSIILGLFPSLRASSPNLLQLVQQDSRGSSGASSQRLRSILVVAETALGLILLVASGLLLRSFNHLLKVDPGFNPANVLTFTVDLPPSRYKQEKLIQFQNDLMRRLRSAPGVSSVAGIWPLPLSDSYARISFNIEGRPASTAEEPVADLRVTSPEYFKTLNIPLISGRDFNETDTAASTEKIIINREFARQFFPNGDAIGKHITPGIDIRQKRPPREIIGIVGNVKHRALSASFTPEYYLPYQQIPALLTICVRTKIDPMAVVPEVKKEVAMLDPDVPIYHVETLENYLEASLAPSRYRTTLMAAFALLALLLTSIGTYSVIAYTVTQRTQEIGIRMALGGTRADIVYIVLKAGLRLTALGGIIGIVAAVILARSLSSVTSLLFAVKPLDPATFLVVIGLLFITCLLATYIPARRAATLDPIVAMRRGQ